LTVPALFGIFSDKKSVLGGKFTVKNSKVPGTKAKTELFHPKIYVDARSLELPLFYHRFGGCANS
jgi:hypothetical protein